MKGKGLKSENNNRIKNPGLLLLVLLCYCKTEVGARIRFVFYTELLSVCEQMFIRKTENSKYNTYHVSCL